jgi:hypothetical protein
VGLARSHLVVERRTVLAVVREQRIAAVVRQPWHTDIQVILLVSHSHIINKC